MKLLCHRGMWKIPEEKNTLDALLRAVEVGFGVETDIRDCAGSLVISHDPPCGKDVLLFERFLEAYCNSPYRPLLALNVKADGLQARLEELLGNFGVSSYFVFDMSLPDTLLYLRRSMSVAVRLSEYEDGGRLLGSADTVWLDAFESDWYSVDRVIALLAAGKRVCVVSPELHRRSHTSLWDQLASVPADIARKLYLCTDLFEQAKEVFDVVQD